MMAWLLVPSRLLPMLLIAALGVLGVRTLIEHDRRIRAEEQAVARAALDSSTVAHWRGLYEADARRVDTLVLATRQVIAPTKEVLRTAIERITDTILVRAALDSATHTLDRCTDILDACAKFRNTATHTIDSISGLLRTRDALVLKPLQQGRLSRGAQIGLGYCIAADGHRNPCLAITYGFSVRF